MPKKSRKDRVKYKVRRSPKVSAVKEASPAAQPLPVSSRQAVMTKSPVITAERVDRYPYVRMELRRNLTIAAVLFVIFIVLYFLLR